MKNAVLTFAVLGCLLVVAANAIFGFRTSDYMLDGLVAAAIFAFVSFAGLAGHAVADRLWSINQLWAVGIGVITVGAMVVSLTNSLGFVVLRGEASRTASVAEMSAITEARAELEQLLERRTNLPAYTPATDAQVSRHGMPPPPLRLPARPSARSAGTPTAERGRSTRSPQTMPWSPSRATGQPPRSLRSSDSKIVDAKAKLAGMGDGTEANPLGTALAAWRPA